MYLDRGKALSPVSTNGIGFVRPGNGSSAGIFNGLSGLSSAFFNEHQLQACPSGLRPFVPTSAYKHSYSGPATTRAIILSLPL